MSSTASTAPLPGGKRLPARPCTVCVHPKLHEIHDLISEGRETIQTIANRYNVSVSALSRHRVNHVYKLRQSLESKLVSAYISGANLAIADREKRVSFLDDRHARMRQLIADRAAAAPESVPGAATGLLDSEGKLDAKLLEQLLAHEEQAAVELGQRTQTVNHTHAHFVMSMPDLAADEPEPAGNVVDVEPEPAAIEPPADSE